MFAMTSWRTICCAAGSSKATQEKHPRLREGQRHDDRDKKGNARRCAIGSPHCPPHMAQLAVFRRERVGGGHQKRKRRGEQRPRGL